MGGTNGKRKRWRYFLAAPSQLRLLWKEPGASMTAASTRWPLLHSTSSHWAPGPLFPSCPFGRFPLWAPLHPFFTFCPHCHMQHPGLNYQGRICFLLTPWLINLPSKFFFSPLHSAWIDALLWNPAQQHFSWGLPCWCSSRTVFIILWLVLQVPNRMSAP